MHAYWQQPTRSHLSLSSCPPTHDDLGMVKMNGLYNTDSVGIIHQQDASTVVCNLLNLCIIYAHWRLPARSRKSRSCALLVCHLRQYNEETHALFLNRCSISGISLSHTKGIRPILALSGPNHRLYFMTECDIPLQSFGSQQIVQCSSPRELALPRTARKVRCWYSGKEGIPLIANVFCVPSRQCNSWNVHHRCCIYALMFRLYSMYDVLRNSNQPWLNFNE